MKKNLWIFAAVLLAVALGSYPLLAGNVGKDMINNVGVYQILTPATTTADRTSTAVDLKGYQACTFLANLGVSADSLTAAIYIEGEIEISTDNSTWADAADSYLSDYVAGTNDGCFFLANSSVTGAKEDSLYYATTLYPPSTYRYARCIINITGTQSSGTPISVTAIKHAKAGG